MFDSSAKAKDLINEAKELAIFQLAVEVRPFMEVEEQQCMETGDTTVKARISLPLIHDKTIKEKEATINGLRSRLSVTERERDGYKLEKDLLLSLVEELQRPWYSKAWAWLHGLIAP